jgi:hypothetical protein
MSLQGKKSKKTKRIMIIQKRVLVLGSAVLCMAMTSFANLITNGSFENGNFVPDANDTMSLPLGATDMTGWTVIAADLAWIGPSNPFSLSASDGNYFLDLSGYHDNAPYAGVEQTIPTTIGAQYQLSLDLGSSTIYNTMPVGVLVNAGTDSTTFTSTPTVQSGWDLFTFDFVATSAFTTIQIIGQVAGNQSQAYIGLDNVNVELVPEPGTLAVFAGSGLLALVGWRRFRKA